MLTQVKLRPIGTSMMQTMTAEISASRTLVLGIGNTLLADDGVGVRIIESLRDDDAMAHLAIIDGGTLSFSLLSHLEDARAMLVVDAPISRHQLGLCACSKPKRWIVSSAAPAGVACMKSGSRTSWTWRGCTAACRRSAR